MHAYNDLYGNLPPAVIYDESGRPLHSWRVLLLPFLEEDFRYQQIRLSEPWDSPHNQPILARVPTVYAAAGTETQMGSTTFFQVFVGPGAAFESRPEPDLRPYLPLKAANAFVKCGPAKMPASFPDGTSNTILVVEAGEAVPWAKPVDLPFGPNQPLPRMGGASAGSRFDVMMADGSVRSVPKNLDEPTLRALITPNGNEIIPPLP
jgi:hypothetical protein